MKRRGGWSPTLMKQRYQQLKVEQDKTFHSCLWCEVENYFFMAFVFMTFVSCLLWERWLFILDDVCWMVRCSLCMHLLWCSCFLVEVLMVVYWVMELWLEIKGCDCFKGEGRIKLNCVVLRSRKLFWFLVLELIDCILEEK
jgi:hypothetical protein